MIAAKEIRQAVVSLLRDQTGVGHITGEDIADSRDSGSLAKNTPCLRVLVEPVTYRMRAAGRHLQKRMLVDIAYLHGIDTPIGRIQDMLDLLSGVLLPCIKTGTRYLQPQELSCNITDHVGHVVFYLEYTEVTEDETEEEGTPAGEHAGVSVHLGFR